MSFRGPFLLALLALSCANVLAYRIPGAGIAIGVVLTAALAAIARVSGLTLSDLGLARWTRPSGIRWGSWFAAAAAAVYAVALLIPAVREKVQWSGGDSWPRVLLTAAVVIPLRTAIPEEFAFRGVLWALLRRRWNHWTATVGSSVLFGFWHVAPALGGGPANRAIDGAVGGGTGAVALRVAGTVLFTAAAGIVFCELRVRSGSLLAPILAHWSVNGLGVIFVRLA